MPDDRQTIEVMESTYRETGLLVDPHTAVGLGASRLVPGEAGVPMPWSAQ